LNTELSSTLQVMSPETRSESSPALRTDARRNRERLLGAAEAVFLERGATASLDDVAKRAKVGIATLYRRFPSREALLAAICDETFMAIVEASNNDQTRDPATALRFFVEAMAAATSTYRGLAASFGTVLKQTERGCAAATEEGQRLLHRAQDAGLVRADVSMDDIVCLIVAVALAAAEQRNTPARITHLVGLFFGGVFTTAPAKS
jgi:AcrR family transcriptional regulator